MLRTGLRSANFLQYDGAMSYIMANLGLWTIFVSAKSIGVYKTSYKRLFKIDLSGTRIKSWELLTASARTTRVFVKTTRITAFIAQRKCHGTP